MSLIFNIVQSYWKPQEVFDNFSYQKFSESHALGFLAGGCAIAFMSHWPTLVRQSHLTSEPLNMMLGGALFGWIFVAPLLFYILASVLSICLAILGLRRQGRLVRLSLFWAFLASGPIMLIYGLVSGFLGQGATSNGLGLLWMVFFLWLVVCGFRMIRRASK
tara:strand:+ start:287 stop:772 length:486 start_codon:yes stop_codon:yes gene_type:complete